MDERIPTLTDETGHWALTPGKVSGDNPRFYRQGQARSWGVTDALNAFVGGPVLRAEDLPEAYTVRQVERIQEEIQSCSAAALAARYVAYGWSEADIEAHLQAGGYRGLAEALAARLRAVLGDAHEFQGALSGDSPLQLGVVALNGRKESLGVPDANYTAFAWDAEASAILAFVHERQGQTDRFVVSSSGHCLVFREAANGDWYLLDGLAAGQLMRTPLEYTRQRLREQDSRVELRAAGLGLPRMEFVTFPTAVEPQLDQPLSPGVDWV